MTLKALAEIRDRAEYALTHKPGSQMFQLGADILVLLTELEKLWPEEKPKEWPGHTGEAG